MPDMTWMPFYVADAFTDRVFGGNPAGVMPVEGDFPSPDVMRSVAAELRHSETAFVKPSGSDSFTIRYFTPEGEIDLCGHATIATFTILREEKGLPTGSYTARTRAGDLTIAVTPGAIWMQMARGRLPRTLTQADCEALYQAYGLTLRDCPQGLAPCVVSTGLADILLPVTDRETLARATQNREQVIALSRALEVVGVHMYCLSKAPGVTAECRNFAPLYGIDEEAATGTANGALTFYLHSVGAVSPAGTLVFHQGESLDRPSVILGRVREDGTVTIGGNAAIALSGAIRLPRNDASAG